MLRRLSYRFPEAAGLNRSTLDVRAVFFANTIPTALTSLTTRRRTELKATRLLLLHIFAMAAERLGQGSEVG